MQLTITIDMSNAAFEDYGEATEVGYILRRITDTFEQDGEVVEMTLLDSNGNRVGKVSLS